MNHPLSPLIRKADVRIRNSKGDRKHAQCQYAEELKGFRLCVPEGTYHFLRKDEKCEIEYDGEGQRVYRLAVSVALVSHVMHEAVVWIEPGAVEQAGEESRRREIRFQCSVKAEAVISWPVNCEGTKFQGLVCDISQRGAAMAIGETDMPCPPANQAAVCRPLFWQPILAVATVLLTLHLPDLRQVTSRGPLPRVRCGVRSCNVLSRFGQNDHLRLSLEYYSPNSRARSQINTFVDFLKEYIWKP